MFVIEAWVSIEEKKYVNLFRCCRLTLLNSPSIRRDAANGKGRMVFANKAERLARLFEAYSNLTEVRPGHTDEAVWNHFQNLATRFKRIQDHNRRTGVVPYENLDDADRRKLSLPPMHDLVYSRLRECLGSNHSYNPPYLVSSATPVATLKRQSQLDTDSSEPSGKATKTSKMDGLVQFLHSSDAKRGEMFAQELEVTKAMALALKDLATAVASRNLPKSPPPLNPHPAIPTVREHPPVNPFQKVTHVLREALATLRLEEPELTFNLNVYFMSTDVTFDREDHYVLTRLCRWPDSCITFLGAQNQLLVTGVALINVPTLLSKVRDFYVGSRVQYELAWQAGRSPWLPPVFDCDGNEEPNTYVHKTVIKATPLEEL